MRQSAVDVKLRRSKLDDPGSRQKSPNRRYGSNDFQRGSEADLVRVVGVAYPGDAALFNDFESIRDRPQRAHPRNGNVGLDAERVSECKNTGQIQNNRPPQERREAFERPILGPQYEGGALFREGNV